MTRIAKLNIKYYKKRLLIKYFNIEVRKKY